MRSRYLMERGVVKKKNICIKKNVIETHQKFNGHALSRDTFIHRIGCNY